MYYVALSDIKEFHKSIHEEGAPFCDFDLSLDGVPESKSGGRSIDILSLQFDNCRHVYTVGILQPFLKDIPDKADIALTRFVEDYPNCGLRLRHVIGDAPMRCKLRGIYQFNARFGCDYCYIAKVDGYYPLSTLFAGEERTPENHEERLQHLEGLRPDNGRDYVGCVKKRSILLENIPTLNIIDHIPTEKMHMVELGVIRKMLGLCYYRIVNPSDVLYRRVKIAVLNKALEGTKVISDFSRRIRDCDPCTWKAEECKNLILVCWLPVVETCHKACQKVWLYTVYLVRAVSLPDKYFRRITTDLHEVVAQWYRLYVKAFGPKNCVYNVHLFGHLLRLRELGPVTETSATRFEDHYSQLKKSYRAGTDSVGKQAIQNLFLAQQTGHHCRKSMQILDRVTTKVDDRYVYTENDKIVRICSVQPDHIVGHIVPVEAGHFPLSGLNFNEVLSFKLSNNRAKSAKVTVPIQDIIGKCVVTKDVISVLTENIICE